MNGAKRQIVTEENDILTIPTRIRAGVVESDDPDTPTYVSVGFDQESFVFVADAARQSAIQMLRMADQADRQNGIFSTKKTEEILQKYLAEIKATP